MSQYDKFSIWKYKDRIYAIFKDANYIYGMSLDDDIHTVYTTIYERLYGLDNKEVSRDDAAAWIMTYEWHVNDKEWTLPKCHELMTNLVHTADGIEMPYQNMGAMDKNKLDRALQLILTYHVKRMIGEVFGEHEYVFLVGGR